MSVDERTVISKTSAQCKPVVWELHLKFKKKIVTVFSCFVNRWLQEKWCPVWLIRVWFAWVCLSAQTLKIKRYRLFSIVLLHLSSSKITSLMGTSEHPCFIFIFVFYFYFYSCRMRLTCRSWWRKQLNWQQAPYWMYRRFWMDRLSTQSLDSNTITWI